MDKSDQLKDSVYTTYQVYGMGQIQGAIVDLLQKGDLSHFTRKDNARNNMIVMGVDEAKSTAIREYIRVVLAQKEIEKNNPLEEAIVKTFNKYKTSPRVYEVLEKCVSDCLEEGENHFTRDSGAREKLDEFINISNGMKLQDYVTFAITDKLSRSIIEEKENELRNENIRPSNIQVYSENLEKCRSAIISGVGFKNEGTASVGKNLHAATSIGNIRKNQEDAVLLLEHPQIPEFKMLVVADGMGGLDAGEYASNETVQEIKKWFETLDTSYYTDSKKLQESLGQAIQIISDEIYDKKRGRCGATFVGAIIGKEETLVSNVGDSRAYVLSGKQLNQITEDQSVVNDYYNRGIIKERDDMRFHRESNIIKQHLGMIGNIRPNFYTIRNQAYDSILLFSDGVTDCLSDLDILAVTRNTDKSKLAKALVEKALTTNSIARDGLNNYDYVNSIRGGKDNTTAAVYNKEDDERGR